MLLEELEARVRKLEDVEEIKKLMWNYTYWLDYGEFDKVMDCFVDDARMDIRTRGERAEGEAALNFSCEGKEAIREFYSLVVHHKDRFSASHLILNPVVTVEGDKATGIFYLLEPTAIVRAMWGHGRYDMHYARVGGKWKISSFGFLWNFNSPYDEGWVKTRMALL
jgi:hypothetical protein